MVSWREGLDPVERRGPAGRPPPDRAAPLISRRLLSERPFSAEPARLEGEPALVVRGELDLMTRAHLDRAFAAAESAGDPVRIVDLRALDFLDCGGLDGLLAGARRARAGGRRLVVLIGAGHGRRLFELLDLTAELEVKDQGRSAPG
ncbi:MAG: anti-sigma factor antagonist [Miltoncostaeaceae bacterium]|nr:anti-sigma factor antagonist [Miltoncostaeaceae bacterium]